MNENVEKVLEQIRPSLQADGGDVEFLRLVSADMGAGCYRKFRRAQQDRHGRHSQTRTNMN